MSYQTIHFAPKFDLVDALSSPHVIAEMNDYQFKPARKSHQSPTADAAKHTVAQRTSDGPLNAERTTPAQTSGPYGAPQRLCDILAAETGEICGLIRIQENIVWHDHPDTDEPLIVLDGELRIDFRDNEVLLKNGEMFVVPAGVEHRSCADNEVKMLLIEPSGVVNTGATGGELTAPGAQWI